MELNSYILPKYPIGLAGLTDDNTNAIFFQNFPKIGEDSKTANYNSPDTPIGRGEEYKFFKNTGSRSITIETQFAAINEKYDEAWVQRMAFRLRALVEPIYERDKIASKTSGKFYAPPLCLFTHGERILNLPIVIDTVTITDEEGAMITSGLEGRFNDGDLNAPTLARSAPIAQGLPQVVNVSIQGTTAYPYGYVPGYLDYLNFYSEGGKKANFEKMSQLGSKESNLKQPTNFGRNTASVV